MLQGLDEDQAKALGSESGLNPETLSADLLARLEWAFRPPMSVIQWNVSSSKEGKDGSKAYVHKELPSILDPMDWPRVRLHAHFETADQGIYLGDSFAELQDTREGPARIILSPIQANLPFHEKYDGTDIPAYTDIPNKFKPSDLEGRRFQQPLGLDGVHPLSEILAQLDKVTGLKLACDPIYKDVPIFIGRSNLACGDVMDALRLALTASWRKLGDTYILTWDRRGIRAIQTVIQEAAQEVAVEVRKCHDDDNRYDKPNLAQYLSFLPDDPLALTPEQKQRLLETPNAVHSDGPQGIPFSDLTPTQQANLRERAKRSKVESYHAGQHSKRPLTEEDLQNFRLSNGLKILIDADLPGIGMVQPAFASSAVILSRPPPAKDAKDALPEALKDPKPWVMNAPVRGLVIPVLGPARLETLAGEMKRHGLNVLYYPALYDGYATFPSAVFPLHPALRGANGWAAAVAAMKPQGIRVAAYLQTLAWQGAGEHVHWLARHQDWMNVDPLGHTRLEWVETHPNAVLVARNHAVPVFNYVRPREPQVVARLDALLAEVARQPGVDSVAFGEWAPRLMGEEMGKPAMPSLGFALPDRIAAFAETGTDPVDEARDEVSPLPLALQRLAPYPWDRNPPAPRAGPHARLLAHLLDRARDVRPGWTTVILDEVNGVNPRLPGLKDADKPHADHILSPVPDARFPSEGALILVPPRRFWADLPFPDTARPLLKDVSAIQMARYENRRGAGDAKWATVLYDFRMCPEEIADSLRWVSPPTPPVTGRTGH